MVNTRRKGRIDNVEERIVHMEQSVAKVEQDVASMRDLIVEVLNEVRNDRKMNERRKSMEVTPTSNVTGTSSHVVEVKGEGARSDAGDGHKTSRFRRLDLPLFSGEDPMGWVFRVERYFPLNKVIEEEKLDAVAVCLEGRALNWFQWKETRHPMHTWTELKQDRIMRFHHSQCGDSYLYVDVFEARQHHYRV